MVTAHSPGSAGGGDPRGDPRREIVTDVFLDHVTGRGIVVVRLADRTGDTFTRGCDGIGGSEDRIAQPETAQYRTLECVEHGAGLDDLLDKLAHFHRHEDQRRAIARAGRLQAHRVCGVERVCRFMLETVFALPASDSYQWADEVYPSP